MTAPTLDELLSQSGLPGPRANLTLLYRFGASATPAEVAACLAFVTDEVANSPEEFVAMAGILGVFVLGRDEVGPTLARARPWANHPSWRLREAVAMGLQEMPRGPLGPLLDALEPWIEGTALEQRAVVAGLCEPKLLTQADEVRRVLEILGRITRGLAGVQGPLGDPRTTLRQALGYGWSVAAAALPEAGLPALEALDAQDRHLGWILRENLKKNRLVQADPAWVARIRARG